MSMHLFVGSSGVSLGPSDEPLPLVTELVVLLSAVAIVIVAYGFKVLMCRLKEAELDDEEARITQEEIEKKHLGDPLHGGPRPHN